VTNAVGSGIAPSCRISLTTSICAHVSRMRPSSSWRDTWIQSTSMGLPSGPTPSHVTPIPLLVPVIRMWATTLSPSPKMSWISVRRLG
jgi:hypothetical protein